MNKNFEALSLEDRAGILCDGEFLYSMEYYDFQLNLYVLPNNKLAEIWYSTKKQEIVEIRLTEGGDLQKWLNRIDILW
ncbi:hypothetical protein [Chryseosolibacter indicus]|uniref:Uncharacterized protein n=1 Tax=Chryseosolibacter indicus TaxID=2782351 RepID=A0ABS5VRI3_9BACT|nr:hypothetical protein [Chryseosolibacter indicus]MBT1704052.1 hypothetical protein [Chryseosolibacter indicus]